MSVSSSRLDAADRAFNGRTEIVGRDEDALTMELLPALAARARDRKVRARRRDLAQTVDGRGIGRAGHLSGDVPLRLATPRPLDEPFASFVDDPDGLNDAGSDIFSSLFGEMAWDLDIDGELLDLSELVFEVEDFGLVDRSGFGLGGSQGGV